MQIGEASKATGVSAKMIRHYESIGLIPEADRRRSSRDVKALTLSHIQALDAKIAELEEMRATLAHLAHCCDGDNRPDCPIIESLAGAAPLPHH